MTQGAIRRGGCAGNADGELGDWIKNVYLDHDSHEKERKQIAHPASTAAQLKGPPLRSTWGISPQGLARCQEPAGAAGLRGPVVPSHWLKMHVRPDGIPRAPRRPQMGPVTRHGTHSLLPMHAVYFYPPCNAHATPDVPSGACDVAAEGGSRAPRTSSLSHVLASRQSKPASILFEIEGERRDAGMLALFVSAISVEKRRGV